MELSFFIKHKNNPVKLINHIALELAYRLRLKRIPLFLPTTLDVEPNNWCNFKCGHCQVTHWDKKKAQLTLKDFDQIIQQFPNILQVKVQGMGEPFLNKSTIDMIESLDRQGVSTTTTSNGSVMTAPLIQRLSKLKNFSIVFSIDGGTKSVFEKIRVRSDFDKVTENIKRLVKSCPQLNVTFWVVLLKHNINEVGSIIQLAKNIGVPSVTLQSFLTDWGKEEISELNKDKKITKNHQEIKAEAIKKGEQLKVKIRYFSDNYLIEGSPCKWPWKSMFIDSSGNVVPCCVIADSETLNFGNILDTSVKEIWNSPEYKSFRSAHAKGDIPDACKVCYQKSP